MNLVIMNDAWQYNEMGWLYYSQNIQDDNYNGKFLVGCILWHINLSRLCNPNSCLYIYIRYIGFANEYFVGYIFERARSHLFGPS